MKHLHRYFDGIEIDGVCTGTITYFRLSVKRLTDRGVIAKRLVSSPSDEFGGMRLPPTSVEQYVFRGFGAAAAAEEFDNLDDE